MKSPDGLSVNALLLALKTVFDPAAAVDATFALRVDGDWFRVTVVDDSIDITRARTEKPTVTLETDAATLRSVAFGRETAHRCRARRPPDHHRRPAHGRALGTNVRRHGYPHAQLSDADHR